MYEKIQFIGYEVYTGPKFINKMQKTYLGLPSPAQDIAARIKWTQGVLSKLADQDTVADSSDTLKVFMMPEFFFRGPRGAYDMDILSKLLEGLQDLVAGEAWQHWVFAFGTALGESSPTKEVIDPDTGEKTMKIDADADKEVYNLCLIQGGGWNAAGSTNPTDVEAQRERAARIVMKEHKSNIDFVHITNLGGDGLAWERVFHLPPLLDSGTGRENQVVSYDGGGIFSLAGVEFGVEICLDHAAQRLRNSPVATGQEMVQVQLVPSAGMTLEAPAVVALKGGYAFNVDGYAQLPPVDYGHHTELQLVQVGATVLNNATMSADIPPTAVVDVPDNIVASVDPSTILARGPGQLAIYASVEMPPSEKMPS